MKMNWKRYLAFALALVMILGMVPVLNNQVQAAELSGVNVTDLGVEYTNASNNRSSWTAGSDGKSITGTATGYKTASIFPSSATTTLTLTNNKSGEAALAFSYTLTGGGSVSANAGTMADGAYSGTLAAGASVTITLKSPSGSGTNTLAITGLSLLSTSTADVNTTFKVPTEGGSYTVDGTAVTADTVKSGPVGTTYNLVATPASGYKFVGWFDTKANSYFATTATVDAQFDADSDVYPVFVSTATAIFMVGTGNYFYDLDDAVNYATANSFTQITLVSSGTISDAAYTIPAGITLLIPYSSDYTPKGEKPASTGSTSFPTPSAYVTLTLGANTTITVEGTVEVGSMFRYCSGGNIYGNAPYGNYGAIYMPAGSNIVLNDGATLYTWGYIYGDGAITANSGAKVYEFMQIADFYGGSNLGDMANMFPFSQYYIQNIEVPLTLNYGATEYLYVKLVISSYELPAAIEFIGSSADCMFKMESGSSVTKDYDPSTDRLILDINGDAALQSVSMEPDLSEFSWDQKAAITAVLTGMLGGTTINSAKYILCLNSNMTVNINSGTTTVSQEMSALPGVEISVDKGATLVLADGDSSDTTVSGGSAGKNVYLFDSEQWGNYVFSNKQLVPAAYSPTVGRYVRTAADLKDVVLDVNGTVVTNGFLYTTVNYDYEFDDDSNLVSLTINGGGASIISSEGTGVITMTNGAGTEMGVYNLDGAGASETTIFVASAQLKNGDGTYVDTTGAAAGTTYNYCATHDCWYTGECEKCNATVNVKWMNGTSELYNEDIQSGSVPTFTGTTPTKASDATNHYTFAGWTTVANGTTAQTLTAVTADTTYYAVFTAVKHSSATVEGGKHYCSCGYVIGSCADTTPEDHLCDIGGEEMTECADKLTATAEVPATCTTAGVKAYWTCSVCGKNYSDAAATTEIADLATWKTGDGKIAAMNHADANKDHVCDNGCGVYQGTHEDGSDADHLCDYCKQSVGEECHGGEATCTEQAVCEECGQPYGTKNSSNHASSEVTYKNITATTHDVYHKCCDTLKTANVTHTYDGTNHKCVCETVQMFTTIYRGEGDLSIDHNVAYGTALTEVEKYYNGITKTGYTFDGYEWYTDADLTQKYTGTTMPAQNLYLKVLWKANTYTVTWNVDGATYDTTEVKYGEAITAPTPTKAAVKCTTYTFSGWKDAEGNAVPATMPAKDLTFEASFTEKTVHSETTKYGDITETTHDILCSVCDEVLTDNASHSYGTDGKCACGQIAAAAVISGETTVYYSTLKEAISSSTVKNSTSADTTVKLMRDIYQVGDQQISSGKFTLDLNGKTVSIVGISALRISGSGVDLTITSTAGGGAITNARNSDSNIALQVDSGTVNIAGGTIRANGYAVKMQNGTLNISGGTVKGVDSGVYINGGTANISGGTIEGCLYAVSVNGGTANVSGGTIQDNSHGVYLSGGTANISGGTIECRSDGVFVGNGKVDITGGTIRGQENDIEYGIYTTGTITLGVNETTGVGATFPGGIEVSVTTLNAILAEGVSYWQGNTQQAPADDATSITGGDVTVKTAKYTLTFKDSNGNVLSETEVEYGADITYPDTEKEGYTFTGWDSDATTMPASDLTITGTWTVNTYTLTVHVNATGETVKLTVPYGTKLIDVLNKAVEDSKLPGFNAKFRIESQYYNGYYITSNYYRGKNDPSIWIYSNSGMTMPADDFEIEQEADFMGWDYYFDYSFDENWNATETYAGATYKGEDGYLLVGWHYIEEDFDDVEGGAWYYFAQGTGDWDWIYFRAEDITRVPYNTELGYGPDQETLAYCESKGIEFIDATEAWFVFDENGKFQSNLTGMTEDNRWAVNGMIAWHPGLVEADDVYYYFIGDETNGGNTLANGDIYIQRNNTDHKAQVNEIYNFVDGKFSGYNGMVDGKYYEDSQLMLGKGLVQVGDNYIYVRSTGYFVVNADFWITANSYNIVPGMYHFDENGYLQGVQYTDKNGIFFEDGGYYYYVEGVRNYAGLIQYTGTADDGTVYENDWIYVRSNGQLATGEYWITKTNDNKEAKLYVFDDTGAMIDTTGIIEENGSLYYYVEGILQQGAGLIEIDGNYYYVRTSGEVVNNTSYWITNVNDTGVIAGTYTFDENGVMQDPKFETTEEATTGIYDGYYYVDGKIAYGAGLVELEDGSIIYVRSNGQLATGKYWPTTLNGVLPAGMYDFGEDGILVTE